MPKPKRKHPRRPSTKPSRPPRPSVTIEPAPGAFAKTLPLLIERHSWGEHRQGDIANIQTSADKSLLSLRKRLLDSPELRAIRRRDTNFRMFLQAHATPFRPGLYLVSLGMVERVDAEAKVWEAERNRLADSAAAAYPDHVARMPNLLKDQFNPRDYPSEQRFRAAFSVSWRFIDIGVPGLLKEVKADLFERERVKLEAVSKQAEHIIEQHLAGALLDITQHLGDLLSPGPGGKKRQLRDGALDDLMHYIQTLPLRDVTNFSALKKVTGQLERLAKGLDVDQLREDPDLRARTAAAMVEAKTALEELVEDAPERQILIRQEAS